MQAERILLIQTAYLGDTILVTALIRAVRKIFPDAVLDILVIPQTADVLRNNPHLNQILLFDKRNNKLRAFLKTLKQIKDNRYDLVITPHSSFTTGLLIRLSKIPVRVGFKRNPIRFFLNRQIPMPDHGHTVEKNLALLKAFTEQSFSVQTELFPSEREKTKARKLLEPLSEKRPFIAVAPGSVWRTKRWLSEYYVELSESLKDRFSLIFIGSRDERDLCAEIIEKASADGALNLAGALTLPESAAVIELCDLMICNDSGALHLANAVQTDVFAFFGPTVREFGFYPFRPNDHVFEIDLYCRPCGKHGAEKCPEGHFRCMKEIKPQDVLKKVKEKFGIS
ncbi:MAG: lipopolysaccharide heptosyltransferase II [Calditrichaeota bacterium]|nr:lipopolysaccharide heptosyltransferase II [Calditrichota bacterium]